MVIHLCYQNLDEAHAYKLLQGDACSIIAQHCLPIAPHDLILGQFSYTFWIMFWSHYTHSHLHQALLENCSGSFGRSSWSRSWKFKVRLTCRCHGDGPYHCVCLHIQWGYQYSELWSTRADDEISDILWTQTGMSGQRYMIWLGNTIQSWGENFSQWSEGWSLPSFDPLVIILHASKLPPCAHIHIGP